MGVRVLHAGFVPHDLAESFVQIRNAKTPKMWRRESSKLKIQYWVPPIGNFSSVALNSPDS